MARLFGTDGIRGRAGDKLTVELAVQLGGAYGAVLADGGVTGPVVLGQDPRESSPELVRGLATGFHAAGIDVINLGVVPTPLVAWRAAQGDCAGGAMVSASHNPYFDNGIKFFGADGYKLSDAQEDDIESRIAGVDTDLDLREIPTVADDVIANWIDHVVETVATDLSGLRIAVDAANGAAAHVAPALYERLGAEVIGLHCEPSGTNINDGCGSTHPEVVAKATVNAGADLGIAHDGDADRMIAVAADGTIVDGDVVLALLAAYLHSEGRLANSTVVTTVMTNLGFRHAMDAAGIAVETTAVGDRYVLERMRGKGLNLGGEQSGHLIQLDHATTGDGLLTAATLMAHVVRTGKPLAELAQIMQRLPQVLINVIVRDTAELEAAEAVWSATRAAADELGDDGRILVRASGTEPKVRVMVEAATTETAERVAQTVAEIVKRDLA